MVEYLRAGRWEKKLDLMFTEELQKCIGSIQYGGIETFCLLRLLKILKHFGTENCVWILWLIFLSKRFKIFKSKYLLGGKIFQYPYTVYY